MKLFYLHLALILLAALAFGQASLGGTSKLGGSASMGGGGATAGIVCVQGGTGCTSATSTSASIATAGTLTLTLGSAVGSAHFVVAHLSYPFADYPTTPLFNSVAMTCLQYSTTTDATDSICYLANVTGGTVGTFTCPNACGGIIYEFSGVVTTSPLDVTSTTYTNTASWTATTSAGLAGTGELGFGVLYCNATGNCGNVVNSPFLSGQCVDYATASGDDMLTCWVVLSSASAATFSGTSTDPPTGVAIAAFK